MINLNLDDRDDGLLGRITPEELWIIVHVAKRMRSWRMKAWPGIKTIAKDCRWSVNTTRKWRDSIREKHIIEMEDRPGRSPIYRFIVGGIGVYTPLDEIDAVEEREDSPLPNSGTPPLPDSGTPPLPDSGTPPLPDSGTQKGIKKGKGLKKEYSVFIDAVIKDLNTRCGSQYSATRADTVKHLTARFKEGFTVDDALLVNKYKVQKWRDDDEMKKFIRPSTLYASSHFEDYLEEAKAAAKESAPNAGKSTALSPKERGKAYCFEILDTFLLGQDPEIRVNEYDYLKAFLSEIPTGSGKTSLPYTGYMDYVKKHLNGAPAGIIAEAAKAEAIRDWVKGLSWKNDFFRELFKKRKQ